MMDITRGTTKSRWSVFDTRPPPMRAQEPRRFSLDNDRSRPLTMNRSFSNEFCSTQIVNQSDADLNRLFEPSAISQPRKLCDSGSQRRRALTGMGSPRAPGNQGRGDDDLLLYDGTTIFDDKVLNPDGAIGTCWCCDNESSCSSPWSQ